MRQALKFHIEMIPFLDLKKHQLVMKISRRYPSPIEDKPKNESTSNETMLDNRSTAIKSSSIETNNQQISTGNKNSREKRETKDRWMLLCTPCVVAPFGNSPDNNYIGKMTLENCQNACKTNSLCTAIQYGKTSCCNDECWLKYRSTLETKIHNGFDSYLFVDRIEGKLSFRDENQFYIA